MAYRVTGDLSFQAEDLAGSGPNSKPSTSRQERPRFPISPESVLKAFNTRAFKREQPDNPDLMLQIVARSIARNEPVPFVLYWGKGPRANIAKPEVNCLDYLASLDARIRQRHPPGATITLIFTDTHAGLNGHSAESIAAYFNDLTVHAAQRGFATKQLSELLAGTDLAVEARAESVPEELMPSLRESASKWFRGNGTIDEGATRYYQLNMVEKQVVERAFLHAIFVTFNGSEMRSLFPAHLPIFYMYSVRHGVCDKPWFLPADVASHQAPSNVHVLELAPTT
jgi:L-tyrosine isonitrile synthase